MSGSLQQRCGSVVACCRVEGTDCGSTCLGSFQGGYHINFSVSPITNCHKFEYLKPAQIYSLVFWRPEMSSVSNKRTVLLLGSPDHNSFSCPFPILEDMVKLLPLANSPHVYLHNTFSVSYWFCSNIFLSSRYFLNLFLNQDFLSLSLFIYNFIVLTFIMILVKLPYISYVKSGYSLCFLLHI